VTLGARHRRTGGFRRWTRVAGHRLHSVEVPSAGDHDRPPVVFLHGAVVTHRYFLPLMHTLASRDPERDLAAVELPGTGASSRGAEPRSIAGQAAIVGSWLRATGRAPAVLVGSSMGAQTAVEVAVREPGSVEALVLIGPTVDAGARTLRSQLGKLIVDGTVESPSQLAITAGDLFRSNPRAMIRYARASLDHRIEDRLAAVDAPVVLVRGEFDPLVPRRWLRRLERAAPCARVVEIAGAAHCAHERRPDEVADSIDRSCSPTPRHG
jgi:2-hydroxy-6-oxonona-2,4-dienedioate hydrolase